jgi:Tfp pilus assembly protein PilF
VVDLEAYQLYLKGQQCRQRYTEDQLRKALEFFERAIAIEPRYALAHDAVAWVHVILALGHGAGTVRPCEAYARARQAVELALESDPSCGDAYGTLGALQFMADYDWAGAERSFRRGLELTPGSASMLDAFGLLLAAQERFDEAIAVQRRAQELDPLAPVRTSDLATTLLRAGRPDEAAREARRLVEIDADYPIGHATLGWICIFQGHAAEGLDELRKAVSLSPGNTVFLAQLGEAFGLVGERTSARRARSWSRWRENATSCRTISPTATQAWASMTRRWTCSSRRSRNGPAASTASRDPSCSRRSASILVSKRCCAR